MDFASKRTLTLLPNIKISCICLITKHQSSIKKQMTQKREDSYKK
jgi:hypothetical protein